MYSYYPELKITDPKGETRSFRLDKRYPETQYRIGRYPDNDIVLADDPKTPETLIRRWDHCILSREPGGWFVKDNSESGTILIRQGNDVDLKIFKERKEYLLHEDIIKVQGWQLQFLDLDPDKTKKSFETKSMICGPWVFNLSQSSLYEVVNGRRVKVNLAPREQRMLCFMAARNIENDHKPTICQYDELEKVVDPKYSEINFQAGDYKEQIQIVAKRIREKLKTVTEDDRNKWLKNESGIGYSLHIYCES